MPAPPLRSGSKLVIMENTGVRSIFREERPRGQARAALLWKKEIGMKNKI